MSEELERTMVTIYTVNWFCTKCKRVQNSNSEEKPLNAKHTCDVCGKKLKKVDDIEEVEMFVVMKEDN